MKKEEYQRRNSNNGNYSGQGRRESQWRKEGQEQQAPGREQVQARERGNGARNYHRESSSSASRDNLPRTGNSSRYGSKSRAAETIDDIKIDIARIEKEIELEIKEIRSMRLGL